MPIRAEKLLIFGIVLALAYVGQAAIGIDWSALGRWQAFDSFRRWSGLALVSTFAVAWILPVVRAQSGPEKMVRMRRIHEWAGISMIPLLLFHAAKLGHGLAFALGAGTLLLVVVGLLHPRVLVEPTDRYRRAWCLVHISLACVVVGLVAFHVFGAFAYAGALTSR